MSEDTFERQHLNCDAPWTCSRCGEPQCPRCTPSPREPDVCANCDWLEAS